MKEGSPATRPRRRKRRVALRLLLLLVLAYAVWLTVQVLSYRTYLTGFAAPFREIEGAYHMHSRFSDGRAGMDEIAALAAETGLDFIVFTDHGSPNRASLDGQGWRHGVLVLAGSELSTSRGHLAAFGFDPPPARFPQNAEAALREVNRLGGMGVISHPFHKARWSWGPMDGYAGMDLVNANSLLKEDAWRSLPYLPALPFDQKFVLLKMIRPMTRELAKWDELNARYRLYGFFSVDAHLLYRPLFALFRLHVILERRLSGDFGEARSQVFQTLKEGKFYNAVDAAAQARGFRFWAEQDGLRIPMGKSPAYRERTRLRVKALFDFRTEVRLLRDGRVIRRTQDKEPLFDAPGPGVYRVEVYLLARTPLDRRVPWIVSNPIFLKEVSP